MFKVLHFSPVCVCVCVFKALCCRPFMIQVSTCSCRQDTPPTSKEGHCGYIPERYTHSSALPPPVKNSTIRRPPTRAHSFIDFPSTRK